MSAYSTITRRSFARGQEALPKLLAIPKSGLPDNGQVLWATLEQHLIAPRGLIRSQLTRDVIVNTAG